jgi:hypothetical protein
MFLIRQYYDVADAETLALLEATLNETWTAILDKGTAIADLAMQFAGEGERDPQRLKALVLAALPDYAQGQIAFYSL